MSRAPSAGLMLACFVSLQSLAGGATSHFEAVADAVRNSSAFPPGTKVISATVDDSAVRVELSQEAIPPAFGDTQADLMSRAIVDAFVGYPELHSFEVTVAGRPLWQYLPRPADVASLPAVKPKSLPKAAAMALTSELAGKLVMLHPSHGSYWNNASNAWFRAMRTFCGPNPMTNRPPGISSYESSDHYYWTVGYQWGSFYEDDMSPETIRFLEKYVASSGAEVWVSRNLDKNAGNFDYVGYGYPNCSFPLPKWQTAAKYHLQELGLPEWVWNEATLAAQSDKDIRARPYHANYRMAEKFPGQDQANQSVWSNCVSLSLHSNATSPGHARGTETFWYTTTYPYLQTEAVRFAGNINTGVVGAVRNYYDGTWADAMYVNTGTRPPEFPTTSTYYGYQHNGGSTTRWQDRGVKTSNFGEIREAKMPAALVELAFHDDWKFYPDHVFMMDQIWRASVAWGLYVGICDQFDASPKARLAATVTSIDFPATVSAGQTINGSITLQNQGMAWCWGHKFIAATKQYAPYTVWKLKATAADQFAPGAKIELAPDAMVYPGDNVTFAVTLTAPATPGVYTTAWRMLKEDGKGGDFGATATTQIQVIGPAPTVTSIAPKRSAGTGTINITDLAGTGFAAGATVKLTRTGQPDVAAENVVVVSATKITCTFNLAGVLAGDWNVVVTNPDGQSGSLDNGFFVCAGTAALGDFDGDCDVDGDDLNLFVGCATGPELSIGVDCAKFNLDGDNDVDQDDFGKFQRCLAGAGNVVDPACGD